MRKTIILIGTFLYRHGTNHHNYEVKFPNFMFLEDNNTRRRFLISFFWTRIRSLKVTLHETIRNDDF